MKRSPIRKKRPGGPRRGRVVDKKYLSWIGEQPPLVGEGPVTIHHVRRFGEPKNDRRTVPLPADKHMIGFGNLTVEHGKKRFEESYGVNLEDAIVRYNEAYENQTHTATHRRGSRGDHYCGT